MDVRQLSPRQRPIMDRPGPSRGVHAMCSTGTSCQMATDRKRIVLRTRDVAGASLSREISMPLDLYTWSSINGMLKDPYRNIDEPVPFCWVFHSSEAESMTPEAPAIIRST